MRANFSKDGFRNAMLKSFACDSNLATVNVVPTPTPTPVAVVKPIAVVESFKVYPNPVHSTLNIATVAGNIAEAKTVRIFNATGTQVFTAQLFKSTASFNLASLPAGFYIIKVGEGSTVFTTKFVKF